MWGVCGAKRQHNWARRKETLTCLKASLVLLRLRPDTSEKVRLSASVFVFSTNLGFNFTVPSVIKLPEGTVNSNPTVGAVNIQQL
jgi:hypothetical protein